MIKLKKTIVMVAMSGALAISGIAGITASTQASSTDPIPNTSNTEFSHNNSSSAVNHSDWRVKNNTTKVYIYPTTGPALYYRVLGKKNKGDAASERSERVKITKGVQASVTNWAKESGDNWVQLRMARVSSNSTKTTGWWSPDSTKNYDVYPKK